MTAEQILKLIEAGYTKAEIDKMIIPAEPAPAIDNAPSIAPEGKAAETDPQPAAPASEAKEETPAEAPKEDPLDGIKAQIAELTNTLGAISKAVINPSMDNIKPLGIDDIITKFFKED